MPYWITSTLAATPALLWMFVGVGLPWALVALPRRDWRDRIMVACLALAFGPALLTAWMFVLGSVQSANLLRLDTVLIGTAVIAVIGWALVWRRRTPPPNPLPVNNEGERKQFLGFDERLLILLVAAALVIRWIGVAYWPTTAYDALWVYGYEGRLYTLLGHIPTTIEYYPQFLPLQHTFLQLAVGGLDDHAARAVLPWLHLGSILAVYVMGNRLFSRRVGIYAAAIWALYPHMGEWSRYGDLEVPVTFMFTAAAAFFVMGWTNANTNTIEPQRHREYRVNARQYSIIAGLFLGIGLWTKPTMGAFIWGVALAAGIALVMAWWQLRQNHPSVMGVLQRLRPQIEVVVITGLVCIPLGGMWYVRNVLLGHAPIIFPDGYWQSLAARSGVEFGWPLLALFVTVAWVVWRSYQSQAISFKLRQKASDAVSLAMPQLIVGLVLVIAGVWPSIYNSGTKGITDNRMGALEWLALAAGVMIVGMTLWRYARGRWTDEGRTTAAKIGWLWALGLPYFITWFYSYSYHYRLSFAIVPLMIMPTAVMVVKWRERLWSPSAKHASTQSRVGAVVATIIIVVLARPGIIIPLYDGNVGWDWLWTDKLPDDHARYESGNQALMNVVDGLQKYIDEHPGEPLRVVAPQVKRLPFFFPTVDIQINTMPTELNQLNGVTYFIYGKPEAGGDFNTFIPGQNQVLSALSLATGSTDVGSNIMRRAWGDDDGIFKYTVYELHLDNRFKPPAYINGPTPEGDVHLGNFVRLLGYDIGGLDFWPNRRLIMHLYWQVLDKPTANYMVYIHLRDNDGNVIQAWDGPVSWTNDGNMYSTLVWEPGEYIVDERSLTFDKPDTPQGAGYSIVIGMYDFSTEQRVPITINGKPAGEGYTLTNKISIISKPAS